LFPKASSLKDIYRDSGCNRKSKIYSEALGPTQIFSTLNAEKHKAIRKALAAGWGLGSILPIWEDKIRAHISLIVRKMLEHSKARDEVCLPERFSEFTSDIITMICFGE
ncbi:hypothetical protein BKA64DRAFT_768197, partial [Cadophora sp. MPI-SDFR-AT-0126]